MINWLVVIEVTVLSVTSLNRSMTFPPSPLEIGKENVACAVTESTTWLKVPPMTAPHGYVPSKVTEIVCANVGRALFIESRSSTTTGNV